MSQVPEEAYTQAQYRNTFRDLRQFERITVLGSDANGTHFQWDDARGERHFGVISDLLGFPIVRAGSESITIPAGSGSTLKNVTLSPALPGAIADFLLVGNMNATATSGAFWVAMRLTTLSNLEIRISRAPSTLGALEFDIDTVGAVTINHADVGHGVGLGFGGGVTITVFWLIIRA